MRSHIYPISFTRMKNSKLYVHINGYETGADTIHYHKDGDRTNLHEAKIVSEDMILTDFPEGSGTYVFYLSDKTGTTVEQRAYVGLDKDNALADRIVSYISSPEDIDYIKNKAAAAGKTDEWMTKSAAEAYLATVDLQPYEIRSFYQLINMSERYENTQSMSLNRASNSGVSVNYTSPKLTINTNWVVTSVEVYAIEGGEQVLVDLISVDGAQSVEPTFKPGKFHVIYLRTDGDVLAQLVHFQFDENGISYFWNKQLADLSYAEQNMLDDTQLLHAGVELSHEDKQRIIEERARENVDAFVGRPIVRESNPAGTRYHDGSLWITIVDYDILAAMKKDFYVSVKESDQFKDMTFDKRYKIDSPIMFLSTAEEMLDGEIAFCIEDESGNIVSPFARYDMENDMSAYTGKQKEVEVADYIAKYLTDFARTFGEGTLYSSVGSDLRTIGFGSDLTVKNVYQDLLCTEALSHDIVKSVDRVLFFTNTNWMERSNFDTEFFAAEKPKFFYSLDDIVFPVQSREYVLIHEIYDSNTMQMTRECLLSGTSAITVKIANDDLHMLYAIDTKTYTRSGFVFVNNVGERSYYTNNVKLEVIIND